MINLRHGRNTHLLLQRETTFRTAPTPAAFAMKYSQVQMRDEMERAADGTINTNVLAAKRDESDQGHVFNSTAILCLNDIGQWLTLLMGEPVTTGAEAPYTHTFTLDLAERPSALLELGVIEASEYYRFLGCVVNALQWSIKDAEQNLTIEGMAAVEVDPVPSSAFDSDPTAYVKDRACAKGGEIYDVDGANTLGEITQGTVRIANNMEGFHTADGAPGYGVYDLGQPEISGQITALWSENTELHAHARDHVSRAMTLISTNAAGDASLTVNLAAVEFDKPTWSFASSRGLILTQNWRAHAHATAPTVVLVNGIASY